METSVHYGFSEKQVCLKLREKISTKPGVELKLKGFLNTASGTFDYRACLQKTITLGSSSAVNADTPLLLGAGLALTTDSKERPVLTVSARKHFALLDGTNTVLAVRANLDYDPQSGEASQRARVRLHRKFPRFTQQQDIRLTLGMDLDCSKPSEPKPELYLQLRENNWAVHYQRKAFHLTYDL